MTVSWNLNEEQCAIYFSCCLERLLFRLTTRSLNVAQIYCKFVLMRSRHVFSVSSAIDQRVRSYSRIIRLFFWSPPVVVQLYYFSGLSKQCLLRARTSSGVLSRRMGFKRSAPWSVGEKLHFSCVLFAGSRHTHCRMEAKTR